MTLSHVFSFDLCIGSPGLTLSKNFVTLELEFGMNPAMPLPEKAILDLIAHVPREEVTALLMFDTRVSVCDIYSQLPNLKTLIFNLASLSEVFPGPDTIDYGVIPVSLKNLTLEWLTLDDDDWSSLLTFLAHRASAGNPLQMLKIDRGPHVFGMVEDIERMVEMSDITDTMVFCPLGVCSNSDFDPDELDQ